MLLFYIRHGDPVYSPDSLTERGLKQADALPVRLKTLNLDRLYASSSNRAILTGKPTAELLGKELEILDFCNEAYAFADMSFPLSDGQRTWCWNCPEVRDFFKSEEVRLLDKKWYDHPYFANTKFKQGFTRIENETYAFLDSLGYTFSSERSGFIPTRPNDERIALFAHQGFGLCFLSVLTDIPFPRFISHFDMSHTGVTVIEFNGDGIVYPKVLQLSNDSHLFSLGLDTMYNNEIKL